MRFPPESVFARRKTAVGEPLGGDFALLDLDTGDYFSLGSVGGFIWDRLDGIATLAELAREMALNFEVEEDRAVADLDRFVGALVERRMARLVSEW